MATAALRERLRERLAPVVAAVGADLEEVSLTPAGSRRVLRVVVDRDGGVDLDAVAEVSRAVDAALEAEDLLGGSPYLLEVTSPGVDRPLTLPRHWRRAVGRLVEVAVDGGTRRGRVLAADDAGVVLEVGGEPLPVVWEALGRGQVQVEFVPAGAREGSSS